MATFGVDNRLIKKINKELSIKVFKVMLEKYIS